MIVFEQTKWCHGGDKYHKVCRFANGVVLQGRALEVLAITLWQETSLPFHFGKIVAE
jgi:hypothetical protein